MATVQSNVVTPAQAALNKQRVTNPFLSLYSAAKLQGNNINKNLGKPIIVQGLAPNQKPQQQPTVSQQSTPTSQPSQQVPTQSTPVTQESLLGGIIQDLIKRGRQAGSATDNLSKAAERGTAAAAEGKRIADEAAAEFKRVGGEGARARAGYLSTGTSPVAEGNAAIVSQSTSAQQQAIASAADMALKGTSQGILAAQQAASAEQQAGTLAQNALGTVTGAVAPIQQPYSNMLIDPVTGQPIQQGTAQIGMQDAIKLQVQRLASGAGSYDQAIQALGAYGQAGVNALNQVLGANFDPAQSNANAAAKAAALNQNVTQGRSVELAANSAYAAIDKLVKDFEALNPIFKSGIPKTNDWLATAATFLGQSSASQFQSTLNDARSQISAVLQATGGQTPTDAMNTAKGYLPDGMTPQQLPEKVAAAKELIRQKVGAYTQTGSVPQYNPQTNVNAPQAPTKGFNW